MTNPASQPWTDRLAERPEIFPHQLNLINDHVLLAELSAAEIAAASFLDQRVLTQQTRGNWIPWSELAASVDGKLTSAGVSLVCHVGHCGSTLISRLIAFAEHTQSLREPLPLRSLAQDLADEHEGRSFLSREQRIERLRVLAGLWGRGARHTVIKATSICTDLVNEFHTLEPGAKTLFVYNRPETHIATLLAGQNALVDLRGFAQLRLQRLRQATDLDIQLHTLDLGQLAALSWLSETSSITTALKRYSAGVKLLEFESFLQNPAESLSAVLGHLGIATDDALVSKAAASPVLQTYSKAPEHRYNADTRAAILADARSRFKPQIESSIGWLNTLADRSELVASSLETFS